MTEEQKDLIEYFRGRKLPNIFPSHGGGAITDCNKFVETQILRIKEGTQTIQRTSFEALKAFKERLEASNT